ncbi:hypothetical protein PVW48_03150 [Dinoroseobacter sp. PD6]|uniref:hypothetical protein n=1 Tax=Dinoroseobacter sp. PD6 TaxID=3028384 RepID=UPI00237B90AC|nr:hypothetical protein [Dinoroseobacter sp. PD6]MDD9715724.1 hypothetical protein [Dinoroseobacter sp. PD6]
MHNKFTVVARVRPGHQAEIVEMLRGRNFVYPGADADPFGFQDIASLHYASVCLYDDPEDGWSLLCEHNVDGGIGDYLRVLIHTAERRDAGLFLRTLYGHCEGFDGTSLDGLHNYLHSRVHRPVAGFISAVNMTRDQIRLDAAVHDVADRVLGEGGVPMSAAQAQAAVLAALDADASTHGRWHSLEDPGVDLPTGDKLKMGLALLGNGVAFLGLALWNLIPERAARTDRARPDPDLRRSLEIGEDFVPTNHMLSVVHVHTDAGRFLAKHAAFGMLRALVALVFNKSFLGEINTIHFAHWAFANNNRRLIFVSNYDGSWRSYLDDFTLKASNGLNLAWAHSRWFPKTWAMIWGGASKGPQFINFARRSMYPTLMWYNAYPELSVTNIARNRALRAALKEARKGSADTSWLELV